MKIAMIGHKDFPSRIGGVEVVVSSLAPRLCKMGHSVTVYNRSKDGKKHFFEDGVEVVRVSAAKKQALNALTGSVTATFAALRRDFDIFHYHALGPSVMIVLAKLFGKPQWQPCTDLIGRGQSGTDLQRHTLNSARE